MMQPDDAKNLAKELPAKKTEKTGGDVPKLRLHRKPGLLFDSQNQRVSPP